MVITGFQAGASQENTVGFSIQSLERDRDPRIIHAGMQALQSSLLALSGLEQLHLSISQREDQLATGISFHGPLEKFRSVMRCLGDWLDRTRQHSQFEITFAPAHTLVVQTEQAKVLAKVLSLAEVMLPPQAVYLNQAERYIGTFGELTPAARANLALLQHRLGLSADITDDLNARAMGPFKTLNEKYQHFRRELLACKQESDLDADFWWVMQQKAIAMSLPSDDVDFLRSERLKTLRDELSQTRNQATTAAQAALQQQQDHDRQRADYRQTFASLVAETLTPGCMNVDRDTFCQAVRTHLEQSDLHRGRLAELRAYYQLKHEEIAALEQLAFDELQAQSGVP